MGLKKTLALIETLKANGVTHFKSGEFDITFDSKVKLPAKAQAQPVVQEQMAFTENKAATDKAVELINILKMSDEELANHILPNGAN